VFPVLPGVAPGPAGWWGHAGSFGGQARLRSGTDSV
jgi:hypothetical protein